MALTKPDILNEVYRGIDETSGASYFSDADVIAYVNRVVEHIGVNFPVRLAAFRVSGDGTTEDHRIPEPIHKVIALEEGNTFTPPRTFIDTIGAGGLRTTLTRDVFSSYGFSFRPPDRVRIEPVLSSGEKRTLWGYGAPGRINAATINSSGAFSVTNAAITVTASGTISNISSAVHLDTVKITKAGVSEYYVLDKTSGNDTLILTEPYAGTTSGSATVTVGDSTYLTEDWMDYVVYSVSEKLHYKERDIEMATICRGMMQAEKRRKRAELQRIAKLGAERFHSF